MLETFIPYLERAVEIAKIYGPWLVIFFMAMESSLIPFPSEIVMIPAGFMCARGEFFPHDTVWPAMAVVLICGSVGAMMGAYFNYYLALRLGRPFLHKYGKYFFLKSEHLDRAEEVFRRHGEITTFICRLLPGIRQLISLPAGLAKMDFWRFSFFTFLGATIWNIILTFLGWWIGIKTLKEGEGKLNYGQIVHEGKQILNDHYIWIFFILILIVGGYLLLHKKVMTSVQE